MACYQRSSYGLFEAKGMEESSGTLLTIDSCMNLILFHALYWW